MPKNLKRSKAFSSSQEEENDDQNSYEEEEGREDFKKEHQGYVIDGFVVDDHISDEEEDATLLESRKLAPLVKEEDSDFEMPRKPKRLKKEKELNVSPTTKFEPEPDFIEKSVPATYPKLEGYGEEDYEDEEIEEEEEEEDMESKARIAEMLNEMDIEGGDREDAKNIVTRDWPERLQQKEISSERKVTEAINAEAIFIQEKMKKAFDYNINPEIILVKIKNALVNLHEKGFDIMFQYFYCRQDLFPEIRLNHLWEIFRLDGQWQSILDMQYVVESQLQKLFKLQNVSEGIFKMLYTCRDLRILEIIKEYCNYHYSKLNPTIDYGVNSEFKAPRKSNVANESLKVRLHELAVLTGITPDQLAENIVIPGKEKHMPPVQEISVETATEMFVNPQHPLVSSPESTLRSLSKYMARELFAQPELRVWVMEEYSRRVCVSTVPTEKGKKELDATHPFYPAKRINRRKKNYLIEDEELWCIIRDAESAGLIKVRFVLPWDDEKRVDDSRDEIFTSLKKKYLCEIVQGHMKQENEQIAIYTQEWNNLRIEVLHVLLRDFMYKWMEKCTRDDFDKRTEAWLTRKCGESFKNLIFRAPFKKEKRLSETMEEEESAIVRVMGLVYDADRNVTAAAIVEKNGEFLDSVTFPEPIFKREPRDSEGTTDSQALRELKEMLERYKPELLIVSANCLKAKELLYFLRKNLIIGNLSYNVFVEYGECDLPILQSKVNDQELKDFPIIIRQAICLARFKQDPLVTTLQLWKNSYKENPLLYLPLNPFQKQLSQNKLHEELERVAIECVNLVGVDINKVLALENHRNILQFVSGLGPLKAKSLVEKIKSKLGMIIFRAEFYSMLEQTVYDNCIGFLRIKFDSDDDYLYENRSQKDRPIVLDGTRIHPLDYPKAEKIACEAMDIVEKFKAVNLVIGEKKRLAELELREYSERLASQKGQENQIHTLEFIRGELECPFAEIRKEYKINDISLFYMLSRENPMQFRKGIYVTVKVFRVMNERLLVTCEPSGIKGQIKLHHEANYTEGQIVRARLLKIGDNKMGFHDEGRGIQVFDDHNNELILFSLEKEDLEFRRSRDLPVLFKNWDSWKSTFIVDPDEDFPTPMPENTMRASSYVPRKINHPKFKNMTLRAALDYLGDKPDGDFVIRPSSKGEDSLNITWKFSGSIVVHLNIREGPKLPHVSIASKLYLNKDEFDSLDDIINKYIIPCNQHMETLVKHKKFIQGDVDYIESLLVEEKKLKPLNIPYYFGAFENAPQFVVLLYMVKDDRSNEKIVKEYIKVKPGGLLFHSTYFPSLNALTTWFKENFQTSEYQRYLRKVKPPVQEEVSKTQEALNLIKEERVKDEKNVKKERKRRSSVICNLCNRPGHVASECTSYSHSNISREHHSHRRNRSRSRSQERKKRHSERDYHSSNRDYKERDSRRNYRSEYKREERHYSKPQEWRVEPKREFQEMKREEAWGANDNEGWGDAQ